MNSDYLHRNLDNFFAFKWQIKQIELHLKSLQISTYLKVCEFVEDLIRILE